MPKRRRWNCLLWGPLLLIAAVASLYVVGTSLWLSWGSESYGPRFEDLVIPRLIDLVVLGWLFWISSAIGSFLNVVAYRLPLGRGVGGFSGCPFCQAPIAARDNIPLFGWLALRGRCRTCHLPIASRYPIVETAVGLSMSLVGVMELYLGGVNLPYVTTHGFSFGIAHLPNVWSQPFAIGIYHMLAVACSWAVGLIRVDSVRLPGRLIGWCFAIVALPILIWPPLQIVSWQVDVESGWQAGGYVSAMLRIVTGLAAAGVLSRALGRSLTPAADIKMDPLGKQTVRLLDLIVIMALPGMVVGWQALFGVTFLACLIAIYLRRYLPTRDGLARFAVAMPVALCLQLAGWRWLDGSPYWPGTHAFPIVMIVSFFAVLVCGLWLRNRPAPPQRVGLQSDTTTADTEQE